MDKCSNVDCWGWICEFHSLPPEAQKYIEKLEAEREALVRFIRHVRVNDYWPEWLKLSKKLRKEIESDA